MFLTLSIKKKVFSSNVNSSLHIKSISSYLYHGLVKYVIDGMTCDFVAKSQKYGIICMKAIICYTQAYHILLSYLSLLKSYKLFITTPNY
jgi:hypothetical protein